MKYLSTIILLCAVHSSYSYLTNRLEKAINYRFHQYFGLERHNLHRNSGLLSLSENDDTEVSELLPSQIASNFGSDVLFRPEDEDSPEFKEYLRQLLKMQANRAKAGHASPSSGSADAYVAKLTRLKIEKNARLRVGLPNVALDLSYKPEDYAAAVYEGQEPVISSSTGLVAVDPRQGRAGGSGKVRTLTEEELALARAAEENVKRALQQQLKSQLDGIAPIDAEYSPPAPPVTRTRMSKGEDDLLIDQLLGVSKSPPNPVQKQAQKQQLIQQSMQSQQLKRPQPEVPPAQPAKQKQPQANAVKPVVTQPQANAVKPVVTQPQQKQQPPRQPPPPAQPKQQQQQQQQQQQVSQKKPADPQPVTTGTRPAPAAVQLKRKLETPEVEVVGKALQLLVKHRGGGPFGAGRLQGSEADDLAVALQEVVQLFEKDSQLAEPVKIVSQIKKEVVPLPQLPTVAAEPAPPAVVAQKKAAVQAQPTTPSPPKAVVSNKVEQTPSRSVPPPPAAVGPVPIALGLDKFLQDPKQFQIEELAALRDGIIQCLGLIQAEISSASSQPMPVSSPPPLLTQPAVEESLPLDRELKQTLGLMLKHRGGPGFGHGRLQGSELELLERKMTSVSAQLLAEAEAAVSQVEDN